MAKGINGQVVMGGSMRGAGNSGAARGGVNHDHDSSVQEGMEINKEG